MKVSHIKTSLLGNIRFLALSASFLALSFASKAQDSISKGTWLTVDIHYGFILPLYNSSMNILIQGHVPAFEVDYMNKPACENNWLGAYHCPETGIAFFSAYLNNPAQLGSEYGIYPYINFHLNRGYKERLYFRFGIGLAYLPVIFTRVDNHKNDVIGTHINAMFNFRLNYHIYLSNKLRLETGLGLTHCSNGAFKTPNLGINLITANTGLSYYITSPKYCRIEPYIDTTQTKKIENDFFATAGLSEVEPPGGKEYPNFTFSYIAFRKLNCKSKLGLGLDVFYNEANIQRLNNDTVAFKNNINNTQIGLKVAYEITLDKLSLPLEMGGYLYTKYTGNGYLYNRIGIRYYFSRHFIANLTLFTHFIKADFIEWGVGYKL
jgi:hypothetical protein